MTPQLVVVERNLGQDAERSSFEEHLLLRKVGLASIGGWADAGAPLPSISF